MPAPTLIEPSFISPP